MRFSQPKRILAVTAALLLLAGSVSAAGFDTLRPGFEGELVRAMQSGLKSLGFQLVIDGKYGRQTQAAVRAFQSQQNLVTDGLAGQRTLSLLYQLAPQFLPDNNRLPENTSQQPQVPEDSGTAGSGGAYVKTSNGGSLNLRNRPSYGQTTIAQLPNGTAVEVLSTSGSWSKVRALGRTGYVVSSFLSKSAPAAPPAATPPPPPDGGTVTGTAKVVTGNRGSLNLRAAAASGSRVLTQIPYQASLQVIARMGSWTQVRYANQEGYVVSSYLRFDETQAPDTGTTPPPQTPEPPVIIGQAIVNNQSGRTLNFRSSPAQRDNIIGQIPSGTRLDLISKGDSWSQVVYQGRQGYVMTSFLRFEQDAQPDPEPPPPDSPQPDPDPEQVFTRTLRPGSKGADVKELQTRLAALKYTVPLNASYDSMTQEAVRAFQAQNSLTVDGVFGSQSAQVLLSGSARLATDAPLAYKTLRVDNISAAVSAMQSALKNLGFPLSVNNKYDMPTHQAVVGFQQRNGLPITGIADPVTQARIFSANAKGYDTAVAQLAASEGKGGGPSTSQVRLLHWFNEVKPSISSGQRVTVHHPASGISFTIRFYSLGRHADSEPATWRDTQLMNRAFGAPSWNINAVYVKLPDGRWTLASMHNRPHLSGSISNNGFGGHLCIHFLRDMEEVLRNNPDYGASNQRAIRKAWQGMTGQVME